MAFDYALQKVLEYKEFEKSEAQGEYQNAIDDFEEIATELYQLLKQKEELLKSYDEKLQHGIPIATIQHIQETLQFLQQRIARLQTATQRARAQMNDKQKVLTVFAVDVKKYEKLKEKKRDIYKEKIKMEENKFLDEISVQQFMKR